MGKTVQQPTAVFWSDISIHLPGQVAGYTIPKSHNKKGVSMAENKRDYYEILGVSKSATEAELKQAEALIAAWNTNAYNNRYFAMYAIESDGEIVGMIAAHWQAPYSAAEHFGDYAVEPPKSGKLAEIRLFALAPNCRKTTVAARLGIEMLIELEKEQVSELVISGISVQKRL